MKFLKQSVLNFRKTGAIAASSEKLTSMFIKTANLSEAQVVIELGSGTGVLTKEISKNIKKDTLFFALEINSSFAEETRRRCPKVPVYQDSAKNLAFYLKKHQTKYCDCIISSLPWTLFGKNFRDDLLHEISEALQPGGEFLTFAYINGIFLPRGRDFKDRLNEEFSQIKTTKIVWKNTPPALIYHAIK